MLLALNIRAEVFLALDIRATIIHATIILVYTALMRRVRPPAGGAPRRWSALRATIVHATVYIRLYTALMRVRRPAEYIYVVVKLALLLALLLELCDPQSELTLPSRLSLPTKPPTVSPLCRAKLNLPSRHCAELTNPTFSPLSANYRRAR